MRQWRTQTGLSMRLAGRLARMALVTTATATAALAPWPSAHAQDASALRAQSLAATCAPCHGTQGRAAAGSTVPSLAGMPAPQLIAQMKAFQSGAQPSTLMQQIAKGYSDARIAQLAAYFAAQGVER